MGKMSKSERMELMLRYAQSRRVQRELNRPNGDNIPRPQPPGQDVGEILRTSLQELRRMDEEKVDGKEKPPTSGTTKKNIDNNNKVTAPKSPQYYVLRRVEIPLVRIYYKRLLPKDPRRQFYRYF